MDKLVCLDCGKSNGVELRHPGYGSKSYPRCKSCGDKRLERESENRRKYFGPRPADFDEADAGERWDDDY